MATRLLFVLLLGVLPLARAGATPSSLLITVGDAHSAYENYPAFLAYVDHVKASHPGVPLAVLIDGDSFEYGNVVGRRTEGAIDLALFAELVKRGPTVLNLGNHEADFMGLSDVVTRLRSVGVVVISGNLRNRMTNLPFAPASTELQLGPHTLTIVGVATDRLSNFRVAIRPTLDLADPVVWARENFPKILRDARLPVVMSHAGARPDRQILPLLADGTLFVGAHDHVRFVHHAGRTLYFHSGSWLSYVSVVALRDDGGRCEWSVEQESLPAADDRTNPAFAALVRETLEKTLTPENRMIVGHATRALTPPEAARFAVEAAQIALHGDAAVIGGTSFGGGLPVGEVSRYVFDGCVRFNGTLFSAEVSGAELQRLLAIANQGPDTPWETRSNENLVAVGPARIDPQQRYRLVTTDWIARNAKQYLGATAPVFTEAPTVHLKEAVIAALQRSP